MVDDIDTQREARLHARRIPSFDQSGSHTACTLLGDFLDRLPVAHGGRVHVHACARAGALRLAAGEPTPHEGCAPAAQTHEQKIADSEQPLRRGRPCLSGQGFQ